MDLPKFVSLLHKSALYFARADRLGKNDPFEGMLSHANITKLGWFISAKYTDAMPEQWARLGIKSAEELRSLQQMESRSHKFSDMMRQAIFINCWHMNDDESEAMWKLYASGGAGICIKSTFHRLCQSLASEASNRVFIGQVRYEDYKKFEIPRFDTFSPFITKRLNFRYEQELRAIVWELGDFESVFFDQAGNRTGPTGWHSAHLVPKDSDRLGLYVATDVPTLIEEVIVSPYAAPWLVETVATVIEKFGFKLRIVRSALADPPPKLV